MIVLLCGILSPVQIGTSVTSKTMPCAIQPARVLVSECQNDEEENEKARSLSLFLSPSILV